MIFQGTLRSIEHILEEHIETLPFLWQRRLAGLIDSETYPRAFAHLEERIAAHTDALVLAGSDALPLLAGGLGGDEKVVSLASGYTMLCMGTEDSIRIFLDALKKASGTCLDGLVRAASYGPIGSIGAALEEMALSGPALQASAALEILSFHGKGDPSAGRIKEFLSCREASVRRRAWRSIALMKKGSDDPSGRSTPADPQMFTQALCDENHSVRLQALETAAWTCQTWLLEFCRERAKDPSPDKLPFIRLLAVLGESADRDLILASGRMKSLGRARFDVLTAFGHPAALEFLLGEIACVDQDPSAAAMAGSAYMKMTGIDVESASRVKLSPESVPAPDEFEEEFLPEAALPDGEKVVAHWKMTKDAFWKGERWRRGVEIDKASPLLFPDLLDHQARWETFLRARFRGNFQGDMMAREKFPLA